MRPRRRSKQNRMLNGVPSDMAIVPPAVRKQQEALEAIQEAEFPVFEIPRPTSRRSRKGVDKVVLPVDKSVQRDVRRRQNVDVPTSVGLNPMPGLPEGAEEDIAELNAVLADAVESSTVEVDSAVEDGDVSE